MCWLLSTVLYLYTSTCTPRIIYALICQNLQKIQTHISELEHLGELGHGTCGHVVKMRHKQTGKIMAVKVTKAPNIC